GTFPNQSALGPGDPYQTHASDLLIPKRFGGPGYLIVKTNSGGTVNEFPHGDNNTYVTPITITPLPPADLVTPGVAGADQTFDGTAITVQYTVSDRGVGVTDEPNWTDTIWLARDPKRPNPTKGDVLLATLPHQGVLGTDPSLLTPPTSYTVIT